MGYDFSAVGREEPTFRLGLGWMSLLLDVFNVAGVLDVRAGEPDPPDDVAATWDDPPTEDWPFEGALSEVALAYFAFRSENAGQVPICKLADSSPWIVAAEECEVLAGCADDILDGRRSLVLSEVGNQVLERSGVDRTERLDTTRRIVVEFAQFCRECAAHDGFWAY